MGLRSQSRKLIKITLDSTNDYLSMFYAQPAKKRNLIDFQAGIGALIFGKTVAFIIFFALARRKYLFYLSGAVTLALLGLIISATRLGEVKTRHYFATFIVTYAYGLLLFTRGDNTRGVFMFGLIYPILSIFVLKAFWGNLLIAGQLATSLLANHYLNPLKMSSDTTAIYLSIYIILWIFAIVMEVARVAMERRLLTQQERLAYLANYDEQTQLVNRRRFYEQVSEAYSAKDKCSFIALMIIDVDNFKVVNDTYGHNIGDEVLVETANRLKNCIRSTDLCCRWGGEEFLVLAPVCDEKGGKTCAQKLCDAIGQEDFNLAGGRTLRVTVSIGLHLTEHFSSIDLTEAVRLADEQLYRAKRTGKNKVCSGEYNDEL